MCGKLLISHVEFPLEFMAQRSLSHVSATRSFCSSKTTLRRGSFLKSRLNLGLTLSTAQIHAWFMPQLYFSPDSTQVLCQWIKTPQGNSRIIHFCLDILGGFSSSGSIPPSSCAPKTPAEFLSRILELGWCSSVNNTGQSAGVKPT